MYITMDALRKEIEIELKRTRIDKTRLYELLNKIIDNIGTSTTGSQGPPGPQGPQGVPGPQGGRGPACECKCKSASASASASVSTSTSETPKKVATKKPATKKKVAAA